MEYDIKAKQIFIKILQSFIKNSLQTEVAFSFFKTIERTMAENKRFSRNFPNKLHIS